MIIGVMSDTHGHLTLMRRAVSRMRNEFGAEIIIHLGDDSTDADELLGSGIEVFTVPGFQEDRYHDHSIPNRIIKDIGGVLFLLTHSPTSSPHDYPDDINPTAAAQDGDAKIILYGHTHKPSISEKYGAYYINPGHLNARDNRGFNPTFAILNLLNNRLCVKIYDLDDGLLEEKTFFLF